MELGLKDTIHSLGGKLLRWSFGIRKKETQVAGVTEKQVDSKTVAGNCYPNCDLGIWLRSCDVEVITPLEGVQTGTIPAWINGSLYRNGPGKQHYDLQTVNHLFDAAGLLHW